MSSDGDAPALEERRLALEELKAQHDYELRARELDLKRSESGWISRLFTPLTTTVFAGLLTRFRAFSPVTLRGVCPVLQAASSDQAADGSGASAAAR